MAEAIRQADQALFLWLNGLNAEWLDQFMILVSSKLALLPLYVIILGAFIQQFSWKSLLWILPSIALIILLADQGSVRLFKDVFERLRPCHEPSLAGLVHIPEGCGGKFGFISSHAANSAAVGTFVILVLQSRFRWVPVLVSFWVLSVGYSRIYLGAHYPGDILVGWAFGILCGCIVFLLTKRFRQ